jgi:hypothetical protein
MGNTGTGIPDMHFYTKALVSEKLLDNFKITFQVTNAIT